MILLHSIEVEIMSGQDVQIVEFWLDKFSGPSMIYDAMASK